MKDSERQDFLRVRPPQARIPSKRTKMDTQDEIARRNRLRNSWSVRISLGQIVYYHKIPHVEQGAAPWGPLSGAPTVVFLSYRYSYTHVRFYDSTVPVPRVGRTIFRYKNFASYTCTFGFNRYL